MAVRLLLVAVGGAVGASARWAIDLLSGGVPGTIPPAATLGINLAGCFAIGLLASFLVERERWRAFLGVGVLGGFTTFSGFAADTVLFLRDGNALVAAVYMTVTVVGCLAAAALGVRMRPGVGDRV